MATPVPAQPTSEARSCIHAEIDDERARQDQKWGGPGHDAKHVGYDWLNYIAKKMDQIQQILDYPADHDFDHEEYRRRMVQIAALAVAAIETEERRNG